MAKALQTLNVPVFVFRTYVESFNNIHSTAFLNIVENFMNIAYLYLAHVAGSNFATLIGFASVIMTLSKTVLYWLQEYYCGGCSVGHTREKSTNGFSVPFSLLGDVVVGNEAMG